MSDHRHFPHVPGIAGNGDPEPGPGELIRAGHRGVLETFREFAREIGDDDGDLDPEVLRAVIAFLRQGLLPFATWEEQQLEGTSELAAETAFEHAFLNAEIDALAAHVGGAANHPAPSAADRIRRCIHRIEAVLELHVQKEADRDALADAAQSSAAIAADPSDAGDLRELQPVEAARFLRERAWGILSTVGGGMPYGVPVSYGFDGRALFIATGPGRKRDNLEHDPAVCLTVTDIVDGEHWTSVVVTGDAAPVSDLRGRLHALAAIGRQHVGTSRPSASDIARAARAAVFRITPHRITGRSRG